MRSRQRMPIGLRLSICRIITPMRSVSVLLPFLVTVSARAQFPLDQAVTGDSAYTGIFPAMALAAFPVGDGLMIPYSGSHVVSLDVNGAFQFDQELTDIPLATFGVHQSSSAIIYAGKTSAQHAFVASFDPALDEFSWIDSLNTTYETYYSDVIDLANGDLLACGTAYMSGTDLRPLVRRITATGAPVWLFNPPTGQITRATHGRELSNGDLLITGLNGPPVATQIKVLCQLLAPNGSPIFSSDIGDGGFQQGLKVTEAVDGGSIIWGRQDNPINMVVAKVDDDCNASWVRYTGGFYLIDACVDPNADAYMVTGQRPGVGALVARVDASGDTLWTRTYGGNSAIGRYIRPDGFGGFIIAGQVTTPLTNSLPVPYLLRVDADGSMTGMAGSAGYPWAPFAVHPNPANDGWNIDLGTTPSDLVKWELYDPSGRMVKRGDLTKALTLYIERDALPAGVYMLHIADRQGGRYHDRLVLQ